MKTERPIADRERKSLNALITLLAERRKSQMKFLLGWTFLAFAIGGVVYSRITSKTNLYFLLATVATYILIAVWSIVENSRKGNRQRKNLDFVINTNRVTAITVRSKACIELSEEEDEGFHYLFQLADDKILSLGGQEYYPDKEFPNDHFEIVICYGPKGEIVLLDKYDYGNKLAPTLKIRGQRKWDLLGSANYPDPEEFAIIDGKLEDLEKLIPVS